MKKQAKKTAPKKKTAPEFPDTLLKKVGNQLKQSRTAQGFTSYEDFAYEKDLPRSQYGKYERGVKDMRLSSLARTVKAHGLTLAEFFKAFDSWDDIL